MKKIYYGTTIRDRRVKKIYYGTSRGRINTGQVSRHYGPRLTEKDMSSGEAGVWYDDGRGRSAFAALVGDVGCACVGLDGSEACCALVVEPHISRSRFLSASHCCSHPLCLFC